MAGVSFSLVSRTSIICRQLSPVPQALRSQSGYYLSSDVPVSTGSLLGIILSHIPMDVDLAYRL